MARPLKFGRIPTTLVRVTIPTSTLRAIQAYAERHFEGDLAFAVERACAVLSGRDGEAFRLRDLEQQRWRDELKEDWGKFRQEAKDFAQLLRTNRRLRQERKIARRENIVLRELLGRMGIDSEKMLLPYRDRIEGFQTEEEFLAEVTSG